MMRNLLHRLGIRRADDTASEPVQDADRPRSPIEMYEAGGKHLAAAPPRTQEILRLAEESHRRRRAEVERDVPEPQGPLHAHQITPADAALMRQMAGAVFGPDSTITLPSGRTITGPEMQRWIDTHPEPGQ